MEKESGKKLRLAKEQNLYLFADTDDVQCAYVANKIDCANRN